MTKSERKVETGTHNNDPGLYPKIHQEFDILERIMLQAVRKLRHQLDVQDECDSDVDGVEFKFEMEPQLLERAETIMRENGLPLRKLHKMLLFVTEGYAAWVYEDIRADGDKQF